MDGKTTKATGNAEDDLIINRDFSLWRQRNGEYRIGWMLNGYTNNRY